VGVLPIEMRTRRAPNVWCSVTNKRQVQPNVHQKNAVIFFFLKKCRRQ
jgi:hypothetical protein